MMSIVKIGIIFLYNCITVKSLSENEQSNKKSILFLSMPIQHQGPGDDSYHRGDKCIFVK
jgi:hypothetical protein